MAIYYGYLDDEERQYTIEMTRLENEVDRLFAMYEMLEIKSAQMESDIHLKVLTEGGTYDDYAQLITEADEAIQGEKEGLFSKIAKALKSIFVSIGNSIRGIFKKGGNPNDEFRVPSEEEADVSAKAKTASSFTTGITTLISGIRSGDINMIKNGGSQVLGSALFKVTAFTATGVVTYKVVKRQYLEGHLKVLEPAVNKINEFLDLVEDSKVAKIAKEVSATVKKVFEGLRNTVKNVLQSIVDKVKGWLGHSTSDNTDDGGNNNNGGNDNTNGKNKDGKYDVDEKNLKKKTVTGKDGIEYTFYRNGNISAKDKNGNKVTVDKKNLPADISTEYKAFRDKVAETKGKMDSNAGILGRGTIPDPDQKKKNPDKVKATYSYDAKTKTVTVTYGNDNRTQTLKLGDHGFEDSAAADKLIPADVRRTILQKAYKQKAVDPAEAAKQKEHDRNAKMDQIHLKNSSKSKLNENFYDNDKAIADLAYRGSNGELKQNPSKGLTSKIKDFFTKNNSNADSVQTIKTKTDPSGRMTIEIFDNMKKDKKSTTVVINNAEDFRSGSNTYDQLSRALTYNDPAYGIDIKPDDMISSLEKKYKDDMKEKSAALSAQNKKYKELQDTHTGVDSVDAINDELDKFNDNATTESMDDLIAVLEADGYIVEETEDTLVITEGLSSEESIFGDAYIESALDEIVFEDRYERELSDLSARFSTL